MCTQFRCVICLCMVEFAFQYIFAHIPATFYLIFFVFPRPKWEGGQYDGDEKQRLEALRLAMELGADYVDVEFQVLLPYECITSKNFFCFVS